MNMNKKELQGKMDYLQNQVKLLGADLSRAQQISVVSSPQQYENASTKAALRAEKIACGMRNLVCSANQLHRGYVVREVTKEHGIEIDYEPGLFSVKLPGLLMKRKRSNNSHFLTDPLFCAISEYALEHQIKIFSQCVVAVVQVYDERVNRTRVRDFDNIECKQVLDVISTFVLKDDSAKYCDIYHSAKFGPEDCTKIFVMDRDLFIPWLLEGLKTA